jgi:hypothetical protein
VRYLGVLIPTLLCILPIQIKLARRNGDYAYNHGAEAKTFASVVVRRITEDLGANDGKTLAKHVDSRQRARSVRNRLAIRPEKVRVSHLLV